MLSVGYLLRPWHRDLIPVQFTCPPIELTCSCSGPPGSLRQRLAGTFRDACRGTRWHCGQALREVTIPWLIPVLIQGVGYECRDP